MACEIIHKFSNCLAIHILTGVKITNIYNQFKELYLVFFNLMEIIFSLLLQILFLYVPVKMNQLKNISIEAHTFHKNCAF